MIGVEGFILKRSFFLQHFKQRDTEREGKVGKKLFFRAAACAEKQNRKKISFRRKINLFSSQIVKCKWLMPGAVCEKCVCFGIE